MATAAAAVVAPDAFPPEEAALVDRALLDEFVEIIDKVYEASTMLGEFKELHGEAITKVGAANRMAWMLDGGTRDVLSILTNVVTEVLAIREDALGVTEGWADDLRDALGRFSA